MILPRDGRPSTGRPTLRVASGRHGDPEGPRANARRFLSDDDAPRPVGSTFAGYDLVDVIGIGRRGIVYEARGSTSSSAPTMALKILDAGETVDRRVLARLGTLRHPNLAAVVEFGTHQGHEYIVRTHLRGDSLEVLLEDFVHGRPGHPHLSPLAPGIDGLRRPGFYRHAVSLFVGAAEGLALVHSGGDVHSDSDGEEHAPMVHGRIHPGNLILTPVGRLVLGDFEGDPGPGRGLELYAEYLAPEQVLALDSGRPAPFDTRTDVYSLAMVLSRLVRGIAAETGENDVAAELDAVLLNATAPDPADRYRSAQALTDEMRRLIQLEPTRAGGAGSAPRVEETTTTEEIPRLEAAGSRAPMERLESLEPPESVERLEARESLTVDDARALLLDGDDADDVVASPDTSASTRRGSGLVVLATLVFLTLLAGGIWAITSLHDRAEDYRQRMGLFERKTASLDRGVRKLEEVISAMSREDAIGAANAIGEARGILEAAVPPELRAIEDRLRYSGANTLLGGLLDPHAAVRLDSIRALRSEVTAGQRSADELAQVACCLWDDDVRVRCAAIEACAAGDALATILEVFPIGVDTEPIRIDSTTFLTLYRALGANAVRGDPLAREIFDRIELDSLERLDEILAMHARGSPGPHGVDGGILVPPTLLVDVIPGPMPPSFTREWMAAWSRLDPEIVLEQLDRLGQREDLRHEMISSLERIGTPHARDKLRRMAEERVLDFGRTALESLTRLGATGALLDIVSGSTPITFRALAIERASACASNTAVDVDRKRIERVMATHRDAEIRSIAFRGLAETRYFESHPEALVDALDDPVLTLQVLRHLERVPEPRAMPTLRKLLLSSTSDRRIAVVRAFANSRDPEALHPLARQLFETDTRLRQAVLAAMRTLGNDRALPLVVGILGPHHPGLTEFARKMLSVPPDRKIEQPQMLVLALQELFSLTGPMGESLGISGHRRAVLLAPLGWDLTEFDSSIPERIKRAVSRRP